MDFSFTPEQEAFRRGCERGSKKPRDEVFRPRRRRNGRVDRQPARRRRRLQVAGLREYHKRLYEAGYVALHWPKEWGGGGASLIPSRRSTRTKCCAWVCRYTAPTARNRSNRPDRHPARHRATKSTLPRQDVDRRGNLVPGLLRTELRLRPREPTDARRARRRLFRGQRPEGMDQPRAARRHAGAAGAHRPRRAEAQGHLLPAGRHEAPRHHPDRAPADTDNRRIRIQRSLL